MLNNKYECEGTDDAWEMIQSVADWLYGRPKRMQDGRIIRPFPLHLAKEMADVLLQSASEGDEHGCLMCGKE